MTNGLTVAAPFGGGGVSDVTYDTANADEMQVLISGGLGEAETGGPSINIVPEVGRQPVPRLGVLQHLGRLGDVEQRRRRAARAWASRSRRRCAPTGTRASASAVRSSAIACGSSPTCAAGPTPSVVDGIFANRFAGDAVALGLRGRSVDRGAHGGGAEDRRRPPDGADHAAEPRDVLARLPAPLRRIVAASKAATAAVRRAATGSRRAGRSAPIPCRRKRSPATTTSRTTRRRPPTRRRSAAAR